MRMLVVEDDVEAQRYLVNGLRESGHVVDDAADGETGLTLALSRPYDVAVIDRMLPKLDGLKLVQELREHGNATPILFLSALSEVDDRVKGLKAGGDDYLTKPYAFVELLARIDALMRRRQPSAVKTRLQVGDLELDLLTRAATAVAPRGRVIYATCSSEPEENEQVVDRFLATHEDFTVVAIDHHPALAPFIDARGMLRTLPFAHRLEAFFAAALVRA